MKCLMILNFVKQLKTHLKDNQLLLDMMHPKKHLICSTKNQQSLRL
jgi:hypothetical protein